MKRIDWGHLKSPDFTAYQDAIIILPIGSMEQHGPHLPVQVDSLLAARVAEETAALVIKHEPVLVLPSLWISLAEHHMGFAGSLTLDFDTFRAVLKCVVASVHRQGFTRILLLNGHGGNMSALPVIVDELTRTYKIPVAAATYWNVAATSFSTILEDQLNLRHACEAETSMIMAIETALVDEKLIDTIVAPSDGLVDPHGIVRTREINYWSNSGVVGVPKNASADKGRRLINAAAEALVRRLTDGSVWPK